MGKQVRSLAEAPAQAPSSSPRGIGEKRPLRGWGIADGTVRHLAQRYLLAVLSVVMAVAATLVLYHLFLSRNPYALFYAAVMVSAWYGGVGPGLLATALAVWSIDTFFAPSLLQDFDRWSDFLQVALFAFVALLISWLNGRRKRALAERDALLAREQAARAESDAARAESDAARAAAEEARQRTLFLAEASKRLASSFDYTATLGTVARLAVPDYADACTIDLLDPDNERALVRTASYVKGACPKLAEALDRLSPDSSEGGAAIVVRTGEAEVLDLHARPLVPTIDPAGYSQALVEAGVRWVMTAPLTVHGRKLGALSFFSTHTVEGYGSIDLAMAEDLARRIAPAIANARLYREAEEASRLKDEFLAVVSHELRTPLNAILGWSYLLRDDLLDDESFSHALDAVERNAKAQARIIDDVLDVSRIIRGQLKINPKPIELPPLIEAAVDAVRPAAEAKGVSIACDISEADLPLLVGDPDRLQQVAWNLLTNAVKFTPEGGTVRASARSQGRILVMEVSDTGQGISEEFLPHVFERFRQADASSTRSHGGLGLGLAIVKYLVELHGGAVKADSAGEGRGAIFTVSLPVAPPAVHESVDERAGRSARRSGGAAPRAATTKLDGVQVLVVDDEHDARELLGSLLRRCGADVTTVASAQEAMRAMQTGWPDVLLSDIGMPGEDGYALIRKVRALEADRRLLPADDGGVATAVAPLPAVALTAFAAKDDRRRALGAGFQMHIPKPVEPTELTRLVATLAGRG